MTAPVFKIIPTTQQYDWGKIGLESKVAQFAVASKIPGFTLDEDAPYAEVCVASYEQVYVPSNVDVYGSFGWARTHRRPPVLPPERRCPRISLSIKS